MLEKPLILGLRQEIHKMNPEHFIMPDSKKMEKKKITKHVFWVYVKRAQKSTIIASSDQSQTNLSNKVNQVMLYYKPYYKINIHGFILI